jgi:hypothetical protein
MKSAYNHRPLTHDWDNSVTLNAHPFCLKGKNILQQSALKLYGALANT